MRRTYERILASRPVLPLAGAIGVLLLGLGAFAHAKDGDEAPRGRLDGATVELDISTHGAFGPAIVSLPVANSPRPIVVALHGRTERPERMCALVREIVGNKAVILCPRGEPAAEGFGFDYASDAAAAAEIEAGVDTLRERFGALVNTESRVYIGFSRGAFVGAIIAASAPLAYPRAILIEGGHDPWTDDAVARYAKSGGLRVLFACGSPECMDAALRPSDALAKNGVLSKRILGEGQGHDMGGSVKAAIAQAMPWVVSGDPRWNVD